MDRANSYVRNCLSWPELAHQGLPDLCLLIYWVNFRAQLCQLCTVFQVPDAGDESTGARAAMPSIQGFSTQRARSYISRLPLFTRAIILSIACFWLATLPGFWDVRVWGSLIPDKISFASGNQCAPSRLRVGLWTI